MILDDLVENIPYFGNYLLDHPLCTLNIMSCSVLDELFHYERLEELESHLLGKTALIELELRTYDYYRTAGIVDTLAQKVLSESSLLTLEHVRE